MISRKKFIALCAKCSIGGIIIDQFSPFFSDGKGRYIVKKLTFEPHQDLILLDSINDYLLLQNYAPGNISVFAYEFVLDESVTLPDNVNLSVFAFRTTIGENVKLVGKNFFLFTNRLVSNNAQIILTGNNGNPYSEVVVAAKGGCNVVINNPKAKHGDNLNSKGAKEDRVSGGEMNGLNSGNAFLNFFQFNGNLTVSANGGNGGQGEIGQAGISGCDVTPDNKNNATVQHLPSPSSHPAHRSSGFPAESGGDGAFGGNGGNGGSIILIIDSTIKNDAESGYAYISGQLKPFKGIQKFYTPITGQIQLDTTWGLQGASGGGGNPGISGGLGAYWGRGALNHDYFTPDINGPRGGMGLPGIAPANDFRRNGMAGTIEFRSDADYNKYAIVDFAKLLMLKAESLYLNYSKSDSGDIVDLLNYLIKISDKNAGLNFNDPTKKDEINSYLFYLNNYKSDTNQWTSIRQKSLTYLSQINLGLDVFGNPPNYAPNLDPDYLLNKYNKIIGFIDGFEDFAVTLSDSQTNIQISQDQNQLCLRQYDNNIDALTSAIKQYSDAILSLNDELQQRFATIESLKSNLLNDDREFQQAIQDQSGGCQLVDILHFVTAVVAVVAAVYTASAAAGAAVTAVGEVADGLNAVNSLANLKTALSGNGKITDGINNISSQMDKIGDNLDKFKTAYNQLKNPQSPIPSSLINVDKEKFDQTIDQFLNLDAAKKYKTDYHNFIDYVDLTNKKRIEFTSGIMLLSNTYQSKELLIKQKNDLANANMNLLKDQISISTKQALTDLYYTTKKNLIKLIYLQKKAIQYQDPGGVYPIANYDDFNFKTLRTDLFNQNAASIDNLNNRSFYRTFNKTPFKVVRGENTNAFSDFLVPRTDLTGSQIYTLEFTISTYSLADSNNTYNKQKVNYLNSVFNNIKNIKIMGVQAILNCNSNTDLSINFNLRHQGNSVVTTDGNFQIPVAFKHLWKETHLQSTLKKNDKVKGFDDEQKINLVGAAFGNGDKCYLGVSPFASWKIEIKTNENPELSGQNVLEIIKRINSVDLYFWYYFENAS